MTQTVTHRNWREAYNWYEATFGDTLGIDEGELCGYTEQDIYDAEEAGEISLGQRDAFLSTFK
jgi:hypothetical protein